ncbi:MAG: NTP transferase domain-containing protein [Anaerolineae bacterium]|jgi:mannose-1-phosphate guanylyltransferase|nr:NTP transferase domain-containing protein [Anaerolineae bacterium]MBT7070664.1 NTP transferase domain-containing protein [Anaerolineae bacterium]MBT7326292.1 NTP transferase domain-containing protein [Anaerolineae bacterium]
MTKSSHTYAVIMAGGGGTRLWPVSRNKTPKQALKLIGEKSLFQSTVERLEGFFPLERILVVTVAEQAEMLKAQMPDLPEENFLIEPAPRGTASVVGLAATVLHHRDPQAIMAVFPADHFIRNRDLFYHLLTTAVKVAERDYLVTLGITPTFPATGYGYIQRGERLPDDFTYPVYQVKHFKEKPNKEAAYEMSVRGGYSWNSGMFIWRTQTILSEFDRQMPELKSALDEISASLASPKLASVIQNVWLTLKSETIDYGIMEDAEKVAVLPASGLDWSDVGSWDSLFDVVLPNDAHGNIVLGSEHIAEDTRNSLIYGNGEGRLVVTIGVDDLVIIDSGDVLVVAQRDQAQDVKKIVSRLKDKNRAEYL